MEVSNFRAKKRKGEREEEREREKMRMTESRGRESEGVRIDTSRRRKRSEESVGKEEKSNKRGVRDRLVNDTQIKWRCARIASLR